MKEALLRARQLHRKQKYGLALEILQSNMDSTRKKPAKASKDLSEDDVYAMYDLRADLLVKAALLTEAIEDASVMIRLQPSNPRGYLRLGQIYLLSDHPKEAADTYRRALKRVAPTEECYAMLLNLEKRASRKFKEEMVLRCDPLAKLPRELLYMIFSQLSMVERIRLARVSKTWRDYIREEPRFWNRLVLRLGPNRRVGYDVLVGYISRSTLPLELDLGDSVVQRPDKLLQHICRNCRARTKALAFGGLSLSNGPVLGMIRAVNVPLNNLERLTIPSSALDVDLAWCLQNLPSLVSLELSTTAACAAPTLPTLDASQSVLKSLRLNGGGREPRLLPSFAAAVTSIATLETLCLHRVVAGIDSLTPVLANANLVELGFTSIVSSPTAFVPRFSSSKLQRLTLNNMWLDFDAIELSLAELDYLELKWTSLPRHSLGDVLARFGCAMSLKTLVVHHSVLSWPIASRELVLPSLAIFQFTEMPAVDEASFAWLLAAIRHVKKVNVDFSNIPGPQLTKLLQLRLTHLRCKECPMSFDVVEWLQKENQGRINVRY